MQNYSSIALGLIGCGAWGRNLARNFKELGALKVVGDADPARAQAFADEFEVCTTTPQDIVTSKDLRAVVIATTAEEHFSLAKAALLSGKDVYVEKPLTLTRAESQELCEIATRKNAILMVGHILKYHASFQALLDVIERGEIGEVQYVQAIRHGLGRVRRKEDVLWDFAPHDISMILAVLGDVPVAVSAEGGAPLVKDFPTIATMNLTFPSGVKASVSNSWVSPLKEQRLIVTGTKGVVVFDDRKPWAEKVELFQNHVLWDGDHPHTNFDCKSQFVPHDQGEPLKAECTHFLECIQSRKTPHTPGEEGLLVTSILEAAQAAMAAKATLPFSIPQLKAV